MSYSQLDQLSVDTLRMLAVDMVQAAKSGHPGMPLGAAPAAYVIWNRFLRHNPINPKWCDRDRFILSAGHASALLYGLLHLTGYDLTLDDCRKFRQLHSMTPGHPEAHLTPGVEVTSGPLGQGFANAVGMAIAEAHLAAVFNKPDCKIVDHRTFVLCSDGDLMEGVSSEAASLAGFLGLGKLIVLYDDNNTSIEGTTRQLAFDENVGRRFEAYGWQVLTVDDGSNLEKIDRAIQDGLAEPNRPTLIWSHSVIGLGSPEQGTAKCHGEPFSDESYRKTRAFYHFGHRQPFDLPEEAVAHCRRAVELGQQAEADWRKRIEAHREANPELAERFERMMRNELPKNWAAALPVFTGADGMATRDAGGKVLNAISKTLQDFLVGGSADLAPSTKTIMNDQDHILRHRYQGMNMHFGVREHAMGSILNGIACHGGLIPYGATFLVFSDYMRPPIRLAALSKLRVIYVFTHDSIGVGEDGPTHQPIEHYAALRAIPNMRFFRPADANETVEAWKCALERPDGPTALALTRQKLPLLDPGRFPIKTGVARGGYILSEAEGGKPDILLLASGSEVALALEVQTRLAAENIRARVVSMPCMELFETQDEAYRTGVLPPEIPARLAIEAGVSFGWDRYIGPKGAVVAQNGFGASGPYKDIFKAFGFSADNVTARARAVVAAAAV